MWPPGHYRSQRGRTSGSRSSTCRSCRVTRRRVVTRRRTCNHIKKLFLDNTAAALKFLAALQRRLRCNQTKVATTISVGGEETADLTAACGYAAAGTTTGRRTSMPATRLSNMPAATTMLGVRLDKMLKLTLLRGGPAQELLPGRELLRYDRAGHRFSLHSNTTKP